MPINLLAAADALRNILAPGGVPVGTIGNVLSRTPDAPYQGPMPLLLIRPLPVRGQIAQEGARGYRVDGVLDCWYLDRVAAEQGRALAAIEADAAANLDLILAAILAHQNLAGSVISIVPPLQYLGDDNGPYLEVAGTMYFYMALRVPVLGIGAQVFCF